MTEIADIIRHAATSGHIDADQLAALRAASWADGVISRAEAEALFDLENALQSSSPEWAAFFVEAISHYVLETLEPRGFVADEQADWLIEQIRSSSTAATMTELELLTRLIERAENVPETLKTYVLKSLEDAVLLGSGRSLSAAEPVPCHVTQEECRMIRRIIFAPASDRPAAVSKREAEMLFRVKDACIEGDNAEDWQTLFVQGVGNYLMTYVPRDAQMDRERAAQLQQFMTSGSRGIGGFLTRAAQEAPQSLNLLFARKPAAGKADEAAPQSEPEPGISARGNTDQSWLTRHIDANGRIDPYDQALLDFLATEQFQT
ncbi:hypothetical protein [Altericroceibacterium endophyticum]|uniref:Uncharacterized protein n=1 Tax=Altericroceibacterium endophyticum TaxID=1808508 RepID=A0A6I4T5V0_9SPHN|nr:hypothetical protein [Altericroceibacterium endophyticum]MXO65592.1 hypothetical protein [Altericroceibacterium endophyticum]